MEYIIQKTIEADSPIEAEAELTNELYLGCQLTVNSLFEKGWKISNSNEEISKDARIEQLEILAVSLRNQNNFLMHR